MYSIDSPWRSHDRHGGIRGWADGKPAATDDTSGSSARRKPAGDRPKRPRTPRDPAGTDQATMWPDPWAGHRR